MSPESSRPTLTRTARFAWGAVALILIGVIALLVYALSDTPVTLRIVIRAVTSPDVLRAVSDVPESRFNAVGITSPQVELVPPTTLTKQPALTVNGKPEVLAIDAEFCPFCGAERWPLIVALSRFGRFHVLHDMQSSTTSVFPGIETFSFVGASYSSPYVNLVGIEMFSNVANSDGTFARIATLTPQQQSLVDQYGSAGRAGGSSQPTAGTFPFIDIGNRMVATTSGFSPATMVQLSQSAIADSLDHADQPDQPVGQAIVASANYLTAGICAATGQRPAVVCTSKGVRAADEALGLE